jgi:hypothetical protein
MTFAILCDSTITISLVANRMRAAGTFGRIKSLRVVTMPSAAGCGASMSRRRSFSQSNFSRALLVERFYKVSYGDATAPQSSVPSTR